MNNSDLGVLFESGKIEILPIEDTVYTGKEIKPEVTIQYGTRTLQKNKEYTVAYKNNIRVDKNRKPESKSDCDRNWQVCRRKDSLL